MFDVLTEEKGFLTGVNDMSGVFFPHLKQFEQHRRWLRAQRTVPGSDVSAIDASLRTLELDIHKAQQSDCIHAVSELLLHMCALNPSDIQFVQWLLALAIANDDGYVVTLIQAAWERVRSRYVDVYKPLRPEQLAKLEGLEGLELLQLPALRVYNGKEDPKLKKDIEAEKEFIAKFGTKEARVLARIGKLNRPAPAAAVAAAAVPAAAAAAAAVSAAAVAAVPAAAAAAVPVAAVPAAAVPAAQQSTPQRPLAPQAPPSIQTPLDRLSKRGTYPPFANTPRTPALFAYPPAEVLGRQPVTAASPMFSPAPPPSNRLVLLSKPPPQLIAHALNSLQGGAPAPAAAALALHARAPGYREDEFLALQQKQKLQLHADDSSEGSGHASDESEYEGDWQSDEEEEKKEKPEKNK